MFCRESEAVMQMTVSLLALATRKPRGKLVAPIRVTVYSSMTYKSKDSSLYCPSSF